MLVGFSCVQRLEAEAEVDPLRAEATVAGAREGGVGGAAHDAKRQRVDGTPSVASTSGAGAPSLLLLTVVCQEGEGLEAQEAQVEVDRSLTGAQLKQSLLDAGIGAETLKARDLQLSTSPSGPAMLVSLQAACSTCCCLTPRNPCVHVMLEATALAAAAAQGEKALKGRVLG